MEVGMAVKITPNTAKNYSITLCKTLQLPDINFWLLLQVNADARKQTAVCKSEKLTKHSLLQ